MDTSRSAKEQHKRVRGKPFPKGVSGNPSGRPKGQRDYATLYREALVHIAKMKEATPDELEIFLVQSGLQKALKGNFPFYKDMLDRLYGKPTQAMEPESIPSSVRIEFVSPNPLEEVNQLLAEHGAGRVEGKKGNLTYVPQKRSAA